MVTRNYEQLGLKFRLFSAEVLFNKGLSQIYLGRMDEGLADMQEAKKDKATDEHNVIDDAIADRGEGYTVFSIVHRILFQCYAISDHTPCSLWAFSIGLQRKSSRMLAPRIIWEKLYVIVFKISYFVFLIALSEIDCCF